MYSKLRRLQTACVLKSANITWSPPEPTMASLRKGLNPANMTAWQLTGVTSPLTRFISAKVPYKWKGFSKMAFVLNCNLAYRLAQVAEEVRIRGIFN